VAGERPGLGQGLVAERIAHPPAVAATEDGRLAPGPAAGYRPRRVKFIVKGVVRFPRVQPPRHEWRNQKIDGCRSLRHH
jgi:hypothetical protein